MRGNVAYILYLAILVSTTGGFAPSILDAHSTTTEAPTPNTEDGAQLPTFLGRHNATVTVHAGDTASLDCHVLRVGAKTVLWAKRDGIDYHVLTFGIHTYHNDNRYTLNYEYPNNWKLQIRYVQKRDEGLYECQVSTHPPKIKRVFLSVTVPKIEVRDPRGIVVTDAYYRVDTTVGLQCVVVPAAPTRTVRWKKDGYVITTQPQRGIRVDSSMVGGGLTTWLHIARAATEDSGNYTCAAGDTINAHVRVHVLDGESSAAMQHSTTTGAASSPSSCFPASLLFIFIILAST
ncbi:hemicentin-1-like [Penaeus japonicus]|uniref:hemicentin-1-like n=1 Tax=Penaeus japonicus TaxID=27405 RepID=UPI001C70C5F4|nr:hemicentin-1-like [Penaeus japonicus]XP_042882352.1 hemicentin-1-like [Penaeus japonicus]XP_042882353.1 hemicentin-1-like [Penaeus japonicus]